MFIRNMIEKIKNFLVAFSRFSLKIFAIFASILILNCDKIFSVGILLLIAAFFAKLISNGLKQDHERQQAIVQYCDSLKEDGWKEIKADSLKYGYAYNSAELLARKRCDNEFGEEKYVFQSANINGSVYFKAKLK